MDASDYQDEIEMLQMMFQPEELSFVVDPHNSNYGLLTYAASSSPLVSSPDICIEIRIPNIGYPLTRKPIVRISEAPNVGYHAQLEKNISAHLDALDQGIPILALLLGHVQSETQAVIDDVALESQKRRELKDKNDSHQREIEEELASLELCARKTHMVSPNFNIRIERGEIISDRKSRFLAHIAAVSSIAQVEDVVSELASNKWIASAAHPTIYAYRFVDKDGRISQDAEDDGEDGASKKMLFLLEQCKVLGYVLVVTRWFGGILLGPDRFKRIMECSRQALQQHRIIE